MAYSSSSVRRDDFDDDAFPLANDWKTDEWKTDEPSGKWQITPPIVTGGRMAAVKVPGKPAGSERDPRYQGGQAVERGAQTAPQQGSTPLFRVSFFGPDQQWYSFTANKSGPSGSTGALAPQQVVTSPLVRPVANTPQPALHPAWNEPLVRGLDYQAPQAAPQPVEKEELGGKDRDFVLQIVQPALTGLMDGSVSTLAPIFAVAFVSHVAFTVFLVGMASALGAGISMAFSEALSDDGDLTGRGKPILRGIITGLATFLSGAGHTLPFLIPNVQIALYVTYIVVVIELFAIAGIRAKFFGTSWWLSIVQVVGGGALVVATSILLGSA
ncbi:hypothetical protein KSF_030500 [Reticulibacter mediterranei]|uniref:VIT family protein n=1 Tax=Reticulibacter mediterranei TaxID=2778369 RepID=A0A8J3N3D4_9CHLR|nr:hypothetical protein [Reticulibacter mediterranei]GHO93002.1 hypothetical protein KSF_030500 [Reticulibacter mediterranei]